MWQELLVSLDEPVFLEKNPKNAIMLKKQGESLLLMKIPWAMVEGRLLKDSLCLLKQYIGERALRAWS